MAKIDAFFRLMHDRGASELHMNAGEYAVLRVGGTMEQVKYKALSNKELKALLYEICPESEWKHFEETGAIAFDVQLPGIIRCRANYLQHEHGIRALFREIQP